MSCETLERRRRRRSRLDRVLDDRCHRPPRERTSPDPRRRARQPDRTGQPDPTPRRARPVPGLRGRGRACCSSISTGSRPSTTSTATWPAIGSCGPSPPAYATPSVRRAPSAASPVTSLCRHWRVRRRRGRWQWPRLIRDSIAQPHTGGRRTRGRRDGQHRYRRHGRQRGLGRGAAGRRRHGDVPGQATGPGAGRVFDGALRAARVPPIGPRRTPAAGRHRATDRDPLPAHRSHRHRPDASVTRRWPAGPTEELGAVQPEEFIPVAEDNGLIVALGRHVLLQSCQQAGTWSSRIGGDAPDVSVNISAHQLGDPRSAGRRHRRTRALAGSHPGDSVSRSPSQCS